MIKKGAFIGTSSLILKGVTIGEKSIIAAGSVVSKSVPDGEIWGGESSKIYKKDFVRKLVYDLQITGHHSEYISHSVDYIGKNPNENTYIFILHPDFGTKFPEITAKAKQAQNVEWVYATKEEFQSCQIAKNAKRSFAEYKVMSGYAKKYKAEHVFLLNYNIFQIATIYKRPLFTMSGIYFAPYPRMEVHSFKQKVLYWRKQLRLRFSVLNPKVKELLILNDKKIVKHLNKKLNTTIFKMLPDPIPQLTPLTDFDIYKHYQIDRSRKIFLHFGSLRNSKGTFEIVESPVWMPTELQSKTALLLVGKTLHKTQKAALQKKVEEMNAKTTVHLIWDENFVSNAMMKSLFEQCFAVLMPYKNTEASSGIMGHAAANSKPILASGNGLIGELGSESNLGVLIDKVTAENIATGIKKIVALESLNLMGFRDFAESHSSEEFARLVL